MSAQRYASAARSPARELTSFRVGAQEFCIDIMIVREIRGWTTVIVTSTRSARSCRRH